MSDELLRYFKEQGIPVLRDEEDEPNFGPLLDRAKARAAELGEADDGPLVRQLLVVIEHLYGEIDAMENHISDYGPPCEAEDEPDYFDKPTVVNGCTIISGSELIPSTD